MKHRGKRYFNSLIILTNQIVHLDCVNHVQNYVKVIFDFIYQGCILYITICHKNLLINSNTKTGYTNLCAFLAYKVHAKTTTVLTSIMASHITDQYNLRLLYPYCIFVFFSSDLVGFLEEPILLI